METRRASLPALTSLRFFAAAAVVLAHLESGGVPLLPQGGLAGAGYQAVTFFFVLSGFILVYVYSGSGEGDGINVSYAAFLAARLARIGPAYYLGLALLLPLFLYRAFVIHLVPPETSLAALILAPALLQAWYTPAALAWNAPAWSLSVEVFFYLLFPLLMRLWGRFTRGEIVVLATSAVLATAFLRHGLAPGGESAWATVAYSHPFFHLASFVFGMALGRLFLFGPALSPRAHALLFLGGALGLALVLSHPAAPWWLRTDAALVPLFGLAIFGAARRGTFVDRGLSLPWLVTLGEASFSIYILHTGLIFWLHWTLQKLGGLQLAGSADFLVTFGFVMAASVLVYRLYEQPMRQRILQKARDRLAVAGVARTPVSSPNV